MNTSHWVQSLARSLNRVEESAMALFLGFMTLITFVQVLLRYGFNSGFVWSLEATVYAFSWLVLIGMSYGVRTGGHIAANLVVTRLSGRTRKVVGLIATGLCLIYAGLLFQGSVTFIDRLMQLGHDARDLPFPRWALTLILPIGFGLLCLRLLQTALQIFRGERLGPAIDEAAIAEEMDLVDTGDAGPSS